MQAYKTARENENTVINDLEAKRDKMEEAAARAEQIVEARPEQET